MKSSRKILVTNNYLSGNSYSSKDAVVAGYNPYTESVEIKHGSFVHGITLDGAVGYSWKKFGVEVGLSYLPKSTVELFGYNERLYHDTFICG